MRELFKSDNCVSQKYKAVLAAASASVLITYISEISDSIIIGNILGEEALSAIALMAPTLSVIRFINYMFALGSVSMVVVAAARGDEKEADNIFSQTAILELAAGILVSLVLFLGRDAIIGMSGATGDILENYLGYYNAMMFIPAVQGIHVFLYCSVIDEGGVSLCNITAWVQSLANIALDIVLAHVLGAFGVGLATVSCCLMGDLILLSFYIRGKSRRHFRFFLRGEEIFHALKHSLYDSASYLYLFLLEFSLNMYLIRNFSGYSLAIFTVVLKVIEMVITGFEGIADTSRTMVSLYHSEKNQPGIRRLMRTAGKSAMLISAGMTVVLLIFSNLIPGFFGVDNPETARACATAVRVMAFSTSAIGISQELSQFYLYTDRLKLSFFINAIPFLVMILTAVCGGELFGLTGVWVGMMVAPMLVMSVYRLIIFIRYREKRNLLLLDPERDKGKFIYDVKATKEDIMKAVYRAEEDMDAYGTDKALRTKIELMMEESGMMILSRNTSYDFLIEFSIMVSDSDKATLVVRDGGAEQDASDDDAAMPASIEEYASLRLIAASQSSRFYVKMGNLNRQVFSF